MDENKWLAEQFENSRGHLRAVAYRMLGSLSDADDAVQEAWLHLNRADTRQVENMGGWMTTIVSRICLDMLRSRKLRREESLEARPTEPPQHNEDNDPEQQAVLADSVGLALLVVLETLTPAERLAFVLHDLFDVPFDQIAPIVNKTPTAARQLASRARRRVRGAGDNADEVKPDRQREIVTAFLAASREGDFEALLNLLDPNVILKADKTVAEMGTPPEVRGAKGIAEMFNGRAAAPRPALINGVAGWVWTQGGKPRIVFNFTITNGKIVAMELIGDPDRLNQIEVVILPNSANRS